MADINELFAIPDFRTLPGSEKMKVLDRVEPDFARLDPKEKIKVIVTSLNRPKQGEGPPKTDWTDQAMTQAGDFVDTLFSNLAAVPAATWQLFHQAPSTTLAEMGKAQWEVGKKGVQAAQQEGSGSKLEAGAYGLASVIPLFGPGMAQMYEDIRAGKYGAGAADALVLFGPELFRAAGQGLGFKSRLTPTQASQLGEFEARGGKLTTGQKLGIPALEKGERSMRHVLGSEPIAEDFYKTQEGELERQARESVGKVHPNKVNDYESGRVMRDRFESYVNYYKTSANNAYQGIRDKLSQAKVRVQTGTRQVPGPQPQATLTPAGMPRTVPVYEEFEAPVDVRAMKAQLGDVYEQLKKNLPEARKAVSPGWTSLQNLMTYDRPYMNAMDLDQSLGQVKELVRREAKSNLLSTPSQRIAYKVIDAGEHEITQALEKVQPGLRPDLDQARAFVKEYHQADEMLQKLAPANEPVQIFNAMTEDNDQSYEMLKRIHRIAPAESRQLARTWLEGLLDKGFQRTGRVERTAGMLDGWTKLGPMTKELWFGPDLTKELDNVFKNMRSLAYPEGSATAWRLPALEAMGAMTSAFTALITGHPMAAAEAAGGIAAGYAGANVFARVLFSKNGAALMNRVLTAPRGPTFRVAANALNARFMQAADEERKDRAAGTQPQQSPPAAAPSSRPRVAAAPNLNRQVRQLLVDASARQGVPLDLLTAVALNESGGDSRAVSSKGAQGVMQLMPDTARRYGVRDPFNPQQNVEGGARYLRYLMDKYHGDRRLVLAAYNAGDGAVDQHGGVPPYPETQKYVQRGLARMGLAGQ